MNIQPLRDNIVVFPEKETEKDKTKSGIYLPETVESENEKPQIGKVIEIGSSNDIVIKKGDKIIYNRYSGTEVSLNNQDYLIVKNEDILAVVK